MKSLYWHRTLCNAGSFPQIFRGHDNVGKEEERNKMEREGEGGVKWERKTKVG